MPYTVDIFYPVRYSYLIRQTNRKGNGMAETTAGQALIEANGEMDAISVDGNNSAAYLPDIVNEMYEELSVDQVAVIVESDGPGKLVLTKMTDGYRDGYYGTILDVNHPEAAIY